MTALIYKTGFPTATPADAGEVLVLNQAGTAYELVPAQGGASVAPDYARWTHVGTFDGDSGNFDYVEDLVVSSSVNIVVDEDVTFVGNWGTPAPKVVEAGWYSVVSTIQLGGVASNAIKVIDDEGNNAGEPWLPDYNTQPAKNPDGGFVSAVVWIAAGGHIDLAAAAASQTGSTILDLVIQRVA